MVSTAGLMVMLIDSVVRGLIYYGLMAELMVMLIDLGVRGFDGRIDGDINCLWFRRRD